jgi:hypothetical protein
MTQRPSKEVMSEDINNVVPLKSAYHGTSSGIAKHKAVPDL